MADNTTIGENDDVDGPEIVTEIRFKPAGIGATIGGHNADDDDAPGVPQPKTPATNLAQVQQRLLDFAGGKIEDPTPEDPDKVFFYDGLKVVHLPEWKSMPADRIQIPQSRRLADALWDQGYRRHPELEQVRWQPSPGTTAKNPHDAGVFVEREADGTWPIADPEEFYSPEKIRVTEQDGKWCAVHEQAAIVEYADTRMKAYLAVANQLDKLIESAKS